MKSLLEIRQQIEQTSDLFNIITTMKNISIVNMTHFERRLRVMKQYLSTIEQGFQIFLQKNSQDLLEELKERNRKIPKPVAAIVIGAEKGLCGEFNEKIYRFFKEKAKEHDLFAVIGIGYKISSMLQHSRLETLDYPTSHEEILHHLKNIAVRIHEWLTHKQIGRVVFFHNQLISGFKYEPIANTIFPLNSDWLENLKKQSWPSRCLPTYTMDAEELFYELTQENLFISMYRSFIESQASENASRLSSMQTAEEKVQDQVSELQQKYNLKRQMQVTDELSDIISSYEILKKNSK